MKKVSSLDDLKIMLAGARQDHQIALFTGAGFTRSLVPSSPSWGDLLNQTWSSILEESKQRNASTSLPLFETISKPGDSWFKAASKMTFHLQQTSTVAEPRKYIKQVSIRHVPKSMSLMPADKKKWTELMTFLKPALALTTNFDLILEELIPNSCTFERSTPISFSQGKIPIYHIHGSIKNPEEMVLFESEAIETMMPNSYPSIKIPSILFESLTIMLGYGLGDSNVAYFMGLSNLLQRSNLVHGKIIFINWQENNPAHNQITSNEPLIVVQSRDIYETIRSLAEDEKVKRMLEARKMISDQLKAKWNLMAIKGDYIYWDGVGEFLSHLFEELEKKEKQKSDTEEYLFPFSEWLDIALSHSGNSLGSSFSGAHNWREWKMQAKANKPALISELTRISNENKLENLQRAITDDF